MKRTGKVVLGIIGSVMALAASAASMSDIVMRVGDRKVTLGEFNYFYNKNVSQLDTVLTVERYAEMFADFKRKVLEAEACGMDTTAAYRTDMERYARDLAIPYIWDKECADSLAKVIYDHMKENVEISNILIPIGSLEEGRAARRLADSLCNVADSGADFSELAERYSAQPQNVYLGFIRHGQLPYGIESAVYETPVGKSVVIESPYGCHVIKVMSRRADPGEVKVRHLLLLDDGSDSTHTAVVKAKIDSLYGVAITCGADFATLAGVYTEDPSGKTTGGNLDWFGTGRMVFPFEQAAFALSEGEISQPVRTSYGYHLILKEGWRGVPEFEDIQSALNDYLQGGELQYTVRMSAVHKSWPIAGVKIDKKAEKRVSKILKKYKGYSDAAKDALLADSGVIVAAAGRQVTVAEVAGKMQADDGADAKEAFEAFEISLGTIIDAEVAEWLIATMGDREPEYANIIREYSDGMLLYEICQERIWNRPQSHPEELEAYYIANKDKYRWKLPHYCGLVVMATSDSIADAAVALLDSVGTDASLPKDLLTELRKKFGTEVRLDNLIVARGDNAVADYVAFGGEKPAEVSGRWRSFRAWHGRVLEQPESVAHVKSQVSIDFQQYLESEFVEYLRGRYPVEIDYEVLRTL